PKAYTGARATELESLLDGNTRARASAHPEIARAQEATRSNYLAEYRRAREVTFGADAITGRQNDERVTRAIDLQRRVDELVQQREGGTGDKIFRGIAGAFVGPSVYPKPGAEETRLRGEINQLLDMKGWRYRVDDKYGLDRSLVQTDAGR